MKIIFISIIMFFAAAGLSFSANLTVKVTDGRIGLEDAELTFPEIKADFLSDDKGICVFKNIKPGKYTIYAMLPGYEKYSNSIEIKNENQEMVILLKQAVYSLGEISVESKRNKGKVDSRTTVNQGDLSANSQGLINDSFKTLQLMPGVSSGGSALDSTMYIQGGNANEWIASMDGIMIANPTRWDVLGVSISMFNPSFVESIDLYTAAYPAMYGQGLSGIVVVDTINGSSARWKGFIDLSLINAEILVDGPLTSNLTVALDLRATSYAIIGPIIIQLVEPGLAGDLVQWPYLYDGIMKVSWDITPDDKLVFDAYSSIEGVQLNLGASTNTMQNSYSPGADYQYHILNVIGSARYTREVNSQDSFDISAGVTPTIINELFSQGSILQANISNGQYIYQIIPNYYLNSIPGHKIQAGGMVLYCNPLYGNMDISEYALNPQGVWTNIVSINYNPNPIQATYCAAYLMDNWEFIQSLILELGGREEYWSLNNEYNFNPQAGIKWEAARDLDFYIRGGRYSLFPFNYFDLNSVNGNPDLQSEKVYHAITGAEYSDPDYMFKIEGFYKYYYDLDESDSVININNNGIRNIFGGDIYLQKKQKKGDWLSGWVSYTYVNGLEEITDRSPDNPANPYSQPLDQYFVPGYLRTHTISAVAELTYYKNPDKPLFLDFIHQWKFSMTLTAMSGLPYTPVTNYVAATVNGWSQYYYLNGDYDSMYTPWYVRLDLKLTIPFGDWAWLKWMFGPDAGGYFYVEVLNALDNANILGYSYSVNNGQLTQTPENDIPILPVLGLRIEF